MKLLEKPKFTTAHSRAGTKRALLGCAGHLLGGFVLSVGAVAGGCSPFAVALVAVSGRRDFLFSALGAGLGYMIFGTGTARVRYFAAVLIALVGALAMAAFLPRRDARLPMALSCLAVGLTGNCDWAAARQIMRWCWARAFWPVAADISSSARSTAIIAVCGARLHLPATWDACSLVVRCC